VCEIHLIKMHGETATLLCPLSWYSFLFPCDTREHITSSKSARQTHISFYCVFLHIDYGLHAVC